MAIVVLTRGFEAIVDDEDADKVAAYSWSSSVRRLTTYAVTTPYVNGRYRGMYLHRFILGLQRGDPDVDHINGNGLDNRRSNLRLATASQNLGNSRKTPRRVSSTLKGVSKFGKYWRSQITVNGINKYLGIYNTEAEAGMAYDNAAKIEWQDFSRQNFTDQVLPTADVDRGFRSTGSSRYRGVSWESRREHWVSYLDVGGRHVYLGSYDTEEAAARAYDFALLEAVGSEARVNFRDKEKLRIGA